MNLLLISNSTNAGEPYLQYPMAEIAQTLRGIKEIVFIPYAAVTFPYAEYERRVQARFDELGIRVRSIHQSPNPRMAATPSRWPKRCRSSSSWAPSAAASRPVSPT